MKKRTYDKTVCWECGGKRVELTDTDPDGVTYRYWKCTKCGDKVLDMKQMEEAAEQYRKLRRAHSVRVSEWGTALAMRIPKEIVKKQNIRKGERVLILPEKRGFRVIPEGK